MFLVIISLRYFTHFVYIGYSTQGNLYLLWLSIYIQSFPYIVGPLIESGCGYRPILFISTICVQTFIRNLKKIVSLVDL